MYMRRVIIAIGANSSRNFNILNCEVGHLVSILVRKGILSLRIVSSLYATIPEGCLGRQNAFVNAVIVAETSLSPAHLLRHLKSAERDAGRRVRGRNASRPLDLDIIDFAGRVVGQPVPAHARQKHLRATRRSATGVKSRGWLTLPHPEAHRRRFVLVPLAEVAPDWWHPVLKVGVGRLLKRVPERPHSVVRILDPQWLLCKMPREKSGQVGD